MCFGACDAKDPSGPGRTGPAVAPPGFFAGASPDCFFFLLPVCAARPLPATHWWPAPATRRRRRPAFRPPRLPASAYTSAATFSFSTSGSTSTWSSAGAPNCATNSGSISLLVPLNGMRDRKACSGTPMVTLSAKSLMVSSPSLVKPRPCQPVAAPALITNSAAAAAIAHRIVQQRAQYFSLRCAGLDGCNRFQQIGRASVSRRTGPPSAVA